MSFPLQEPVLIITVIILVILLSPLLLERIRIPGIAGLLIFGMLIGPNGLNIIPESLELTLFSTTGLLYLMFLAGLEIDLIDFIENKGKSIVMGLLSFSLPMILGFLTGLYILQIGVIPSLLIGAMLSSHTLISYPIASKQGIITTTIVTILIGGTIIADVLALISLQVISDYTNGFFNTSGIIQMLLNFTIFGIVVFLIIPQIAKLFFKHFDGDLIIQYLFILGLLFVSATSAELLHIEPIIGAFFCGLVLNRYIIHDSPLYKRIEFIGNSLFIPVFLISVGLLVNPGFYYSNPMSIIPLSILLVVAFSSKWFSALFMKLFYKLNNDDSNLIFSMTTARAASAIAIVLVGYKLELVSDIMINHTIVIILITSVVSSYFTGVYARKKAIAQIESEPQKNTEVIIVPVSNPANMPALLRFASLVKDQKQTKTIYGLSVMANVPTVQQQIERNKMIFKKVVETIQSDNSFKLITRIDSTITNGIAKASKELSASMLIFGWHQPSAPLEALFGNIMSHVLNRTNKMIWVVKTPGTKFNIGNRIHFFMPDSCQYETGFDSMIKKVSMLSKTLKAKVIIHASNTVTEFIDPILKTELKGYFDNSKTLDVLNDDIDKYSFEATDMLLICSSRKNGISYSRQYFRFTTKLFGDLPGINTVMVYPEQN